jgi:capsular polysaccharide transport system ATP-binding protein
MIVFEQVTKQVMEHGAKRCILQDASFTIKKNERLAFLSDHPNDGMTFLNMLTRVQPIDYGKITTESTLSWILGKAFGITESLTARKNIRILCGIHGIGRRQADQIAEMVAIFTGLGAHIDEPILTYRTEMKQRLEFALFLSMHFDFYLIKGSISVGSGSFKDKSKEALLQTLAHSGIILVSPNVKIVREICTSCLVVKNGIAHLYEDINEGLASFLPEKNISISSKTQPTKAHIPRKWAKKRARKSVVE